MTTAGESEPRFRIVGEIRNVQLIAKRRQIRVFRHLCREFGFGNWRKLKGLATVQLEDGRIWKVELHWFEAHGIGKRRVKIKRKISYEGTETF